MMHRIKSGFFQIASSVIRFSYNTSFFLSYIRQHFRSSQNLSYVAEGYCATSINTSIFRKSSVISNGRFQYIGFYDKRGNVVVGRRKLTGNKWRLRTLPFVAKISDAHNVISLGLDGHGYLHLCFGMHGSKLRYIRTVKPGSLKFTSIMPMNGEEEARVTYPEFHSMANGDLLFFYRNGVSGNGNMVIKRYVLKDGKWTTVQSNLIDGEGARNAYWQAWVDNDDNIFISWVWRDNADVVSNHDVCFACSKDGGKTWLKTNGEVYDLPITVKNAEVAWPVSCGSELINQTSMTSDKKGRVFIATYWRDQNSEVPQYRIVWHDGLKWNMRCVGERSLPFTLKGKGTKMIPISRPLILREGEKNLLIFRDKERGGRAVMASTDDSGMNDWKFLELADFDLDAWEPSFDDNLWKKEGKLHLFIQTAHQGDGEKVATTKHKSSPIYILKKTI